MMTGKDFEIVAREIGWAFARNILPDVPHTYVTIASFQAAFQHINPRFDGDKFHKRIKVWQEYFETNA